MVELGYHYGGSKPACNSSLERGLCELEWEEILVGMIERIGRKSFAIVTGRNRKERDQYVGARLWTMSVE